MFFKISRSLKIQTHPHVPSRTLSKKKGFSLGMQMIHWVFFMKTIQKEEESERGTIVSPEN